MQRILAFIGLSVIIHGLVLAIPLKLIPPKIEKHENNVITVSIKQLDKKMPGQGQTLSQQYIIDSQQLDMDSELFILPCGAVDNQSSP